MQTLKQVKLIAADMDGTLLDSNRELPADFFHILEELQKHHILFAVASGRPYPTLALQFEQYKEHLIFMAESGCCIVDNGQLIHMDSLTKKQLQHLSDICTQIPHAYPVYSGFHQAYLSDSAPTPIKEEIGLYYKKIQYIQNISEIHEPICKVTVCDITGAEAHSLPILSQLKPPYKATLSGYIWVDLVLADTHKGNGLRALQEKYSISPDETMVFGDYLNDFEMMQQGYFSYAMANAHPDLKAVSRFETLSNDEDGVCHIIRQLLLALKE